MSPEPKGPTQARSSGPEVDGHWRRRALLGPHNHEDNLFLSRIEMGANLTSGQKECWVCGLGPVKVGAVYNVLIPLGGAPNGTYWLCGKMAYYSLPLNWGGTCTVGFVVTAMRTLPNNDKNLKALFRDYKPPGMGRDKRSLADITHTQAPASRFFGVLFPGYGVACALDQIRQGGTCAKIGDECCTFVTDRYSNVTDLAEYIATVAKNNSPQPEWTLATWLKSLFG
ncbi:unnamed protein product, partial [Coregonus sp. 'balchen']